MRSTTYTHIAFRNIGDSQDTGSFHEGTVSECILWLARKISENQMAGRFTMGMGRTREDAAKGIEVRNAGKSALSEDMMAMLESVMSDGDDSVEAAGSGSKIPDSQPSRVADWKQKQSEQDDYVA